MKKIYIFLISGGLLLFNACDPFNNEDKLRDNTGGKGNVINQAAFSGNFEGVWIQTYPSDYRPTGFNEREDLQIGPGIYAKIKIHHGILKIWYLEGSELNLEEYRSFECIKEKCVPKEPLGDYDHQLSNSRFIFQNAERFIVEGSESLFTKPKGNYFIKIKPNSFDEKKYPFFNAINSQAEINLPGL